MARTLTYNDMVDIIAMRTGKSKDNMAPRTAKCTKPYSNIGFGVVGRTYGRCSVCRICFRLERYGNSNSRRIGKIRLSRSNGSYIVYMCNTCSYKHIGRYTIRHTRPTSTIGVMQSFKMYIQTFFPNYNQHFIFTEL